MTSDEEVEEFFAHFGVLGMKWGVRKDRTVSSSERAKREKKAQKFDTKAEVLKLKISKVDASMSTARWSYQRRNLKEQRANLIKERKRAESDAEAKRQGKLSSGQKRAIIGASVAAAIIATYSAYSMVQSGEAHRKIVKGKAFMAARNGKTGAIWKVNPELAKPNMDSDEIMSKVVKHINPGYGNPGTKANCRRATFAYEMRRRGYDVSATRTTNGRGQNVAGIYNVLHPGEKPIRSGKTSILSRVVKEKIIKVSDPTVATPFLGVAEKVGLTGTNKIPGFKGPTGPLVQPTKIFEGLASQPNGARGELGVKWAGGGAHSMVWEIVRGKPVIFDTQTGQRYLSSRELLDDVGFSIKEAGFTRLDNIRLNEDFLIRWLKHAN